MTGGEAETSGAERLTEIIAGGKRAVAGALAEIDQKTLTPELSALLDAAYASPRGSVLGLTGPPGVGKSTLINGIIRLWRGRGLSVGILAVDPSSRISRGALLGDRVRMRTDPEDSQVFIRSLASRGRLGGLSDVAFASTVLMRAVYDRVIVETVGVGQSEADITSVADTVILCIQPGSGDSMQFMKAGIMEIPDIAVVTKADMGDAAMRALAELKGALSLSIARQSGWEVPCLTVSAAREIGVEALISTAEAHGAWLWETGLLGPLRQRQAEMWLHDTIAVTFGANGVSLLSDRLRDVHQHPFTQAHQLGRMLHISISKT